MSSPRQLTAPSDTDLLRFPAFIFQALTTVSELKNFIEIYFSESRKIFCLHKDYMFIFQN